MDLTREQNAVITANDSKILCIAGAGAGKTSSMIARISRLVSEGADPQSILVLTFTRAAAFEMQSRYIATHENDTVFPEFRTFHAFCYSLLARDAEVRSALGYTAAPEIADESMTKELRTQAAMQVGSKLSAVKLSGSVTLNEKERNEFRFVDKAYRRLLKQKNLITYDILSKDVCQLFTDNSTAITKYRELYRHIFIDEFQDTDPVQWDFAKSFTNSNLFVCGDALQAIYAFRGADSSIIKQIASDPEWAVYKLTYNFRSTKLICDYANTQTEDADPSYRIDMITHLPGGSVNIEDIRDSDYKWFNDNVNAYLSQTLPMLSGSAAVLCRTNKEVEKITQMISENGYTVAQSSTYDESIHLLKCLIDDEYCVDWLSSLLPSSSYSEYIRMKYTQPDNKYTLDQFTSRWGNQHSVSDKLSKLMLLKDTFVSEGSPETKLDNILNILNLNIDTSDFICGNLTAGFVVNYLTEKLDSIDVSDSIYVGTIHSVKGLEYDSVVLLGVGGTTFRLTDEQNRNLFYVGITRAKSQLYILMCK